MIDVVVILAGVVVVIALLAFLEHRQAAKDIVVPLGKRRL